VGKLKAVSRLLLIGTSIALFSSSVFSGCGNQPNSSDIKNPETTGKPTENNKQGLKEVRVQLAFLMQSLDAPLILAINKGYFKEEGLNVNFERGFGNADTISKLGTGKFDLAFSDMYNALEFNEKNPQDKIIAVAVTNNKAPFSVITFKDKGINSPKDLNGKSLGAPAGDGPRKLFPVFAYSNGIDVNSIKWTTMEPKLRETFLLQGKVDAVTGFSTSVIPSLLKGGKKMEDLQIFYYNKFGSDFYGNVILAKSDFVQKNPEIVKGFVKAYLRGMQDMLKDPTAGLDALMAADQSKLMNRDTEKVRLQVALDNLYFSPEVEKDGLGAVNKERLQKTLEQTAKGFGLKSKPKLEDIFSDKFLPSKEQRLAPKKVEGKALN
jgi:NitT/TauT family transport system substrate-binding protein